MNTWLHLRSMFRSECGSSLVELAFLSPLLMLLLLGLVDFGRAYLIASELASAAHAGAVYGSGSPTDSSGIQNAATNDATGIAGLAVATPTWGCECSDGTSYAASCSSTPTCTGNNVVYRVKVTVTATYHPWSPWPGVPSSIPLSRAATMRSGGS
jgi:Flp pilus assembly protein TadG